MPKLVTYNINGIRAAINKGLLDWIRQTDPDVICLQETKALAEQFDVKSFEDLGYHFILETAEKKGYSGVAILSKQEPMKVSLGCGEDKYDKEGRVARVDFSEYSVISVYMPSGASKPERQVFKLEWLEFFREYIENLGIDKLFIGGDFNLCHQSIDIHNPLRLDGYPGFTPEERAWMSAFLGDGYIDCFRSLNSDLQEYSWWSYRAGARQKNLGWRIDYWLASESMSAQLSRCRMLTSAQHSDHCPVLLEFNL